MDLRINFEYIYTVFGFIRFLQLTIDKKKKLVEFLIKNGALLKQTISFTIILTWILVKSEWENLLSIFIYYWQKQNVLYNDDY